jgi:hypothetical protein
MRCEVSMQEAVDEKRLFEVNEVTRVRCLG